MSDAITAPAETYTPFIESDPDAGAEELRARMAEHGYLFFRGLVPADAILPVRRDVLEVCREAGWLDPSRDVMEGVVNPAMEPLSEHHEDYRAVYRKVLRLPRFHDFPAHVSLMSVADRLLGGEVLVHPRRIGRMTFPNLIAATTPAHQDHFYIRGAVETYSCWVPLGACPMNLGGLAIWDGSHRRGFLEHSVLLPQAVGGKAVPEDEDAPWHSSGFNLGDALFFHSYTIHKALPNQTHNLLRLSTDNRYQRRHEDIDPGSLKPHLGLN